MEQGIIEVAVKAVIMNNGKTLLVKRSKNDEMGASTWECVGGGLQFGETLEKALVREVKEEAGIHIEVEKLLYSTTFFTHSSRQLVLLVYLCYTEESEVVLSNEHEDYIWATKEECRLLLPENIVADLQKYQVLELSDFY